MSISTTIGEVTTAIPENRAQTVLVVGYGHSATANVVNEFSASGSVQATVGDGSATWLAVLIAKAANRRVRSLVPAGAGGARGSVTETPAGTGPTLTVAGTPRYSFVSVKVKITKAGAGGVGLFKYSTDGTTYSEELDLPAPTQATMVGTVDLSGITLATLNTTTLIMAASAGGAQTVTFTTPADVADIAVQCNAQTTNMTWSIRSGRYLVCVDDVAGSGSSLSLNASSTGDTVVGMSGTAAGAAGTYEIPHTGVTVTFPATSDYVLDTVYSFATTAPQFSAAQLTTAIAAARAAGEEPGVIVIANPGADSYETNQYADALAVECASFNTIKVYPVTITGCPPADSDATVKAAFLGHEDKDLLCTAGGVYASGGGSDTGLVGSYLVPSSWYAAALAATYRYSSDVGNGEYDPITSLFSFVGPDASTRVRDERTASVALRPHGFAVLETRPGSDPIGPWFSVGYSRANASSKYRQWHLRRVAFRAVELIQGVLSRFENRDFNVTAAGTLAADAVKEIEAPIKRAIQVDMIDPTPKHLSGVAVSVDASEVVTTTDNLTVTADLLGKAQAETITLTVNAVDVLSGLEN